MEVVVLGSLNWDVVFACEALPKPGETVLTNSVMQGPGGKGLNQAVAAGRAGANTRLIGAIGQDPQGNQLIEFLGNEVIDITGVKQLPTFSTGLAHIVTDRDGENSIVVAAGANRAQQAYSAEPTKRCSILLAQLEVQPDIVTAFLREGRSSGAMCILNAAPAVEEAKALLEFCDIIVVNEHELGHYAGKAVDGRNLESLTQAAAQLLSRDDQTCIVTLGSLGTCIVAADKSLLIAAREVQPVDTTGAGDCFCGVLAASLAAGNSIVDAVGMANVAASIAVTRRGAATAMPSLQEIETILASFSLR